MSPKIKDKPKTLEEILESELRELKEKFYPKPPAIFWKVGDKVKHGGFKSTFIEEVLEDGMYYRVIITTVGDVRTPSNSYSRIVSWVDIVNLPDESQKQFSSIIDSWEKASQHSTRDIEGLIHDLYAFGIEMDPIYQREYVWSLEDQRALIDSIFNHIEIGRFALIKKPFVHLQENYEILDGKQRLKAIRDFMENRFDFNGIYWNDLHWKDRIEFEHTLVSVITYGHLTEEQKLRAFLKTNRHGKVMDQSHLEKVEKMLEEKSGGKENEK